MWGRVRLRFAKGLDVEFADREAAIRHFEELAEKGTRVVHVIYGPEGCGKTALFKQAKEVLEKGFGYSVVYVDPLARGELEVLAYTPSIRDVVEDVLRALPEPYSRVVDAAIKIAGIAMRRFRKSRIAVLMDDIFQAVGVDRAEIYVKALLNLIEYPPGDYENIVVVVSSSEGISRERIGRHRWADIFLLWNMSRKGFEELYRVLPGSKPSLEELWEATGGNPQILSRLFELGWSADSLVEGITVAKNLAKAVARLSGEEIGLLEEALSDPDTIFRKLREEAAQSLLNKLIELNLVVEVLDRDSQFWIDDPPPERDLELGIGRFIAWQTPLHREAVRRALEGLSPA